MLLDIWRLLFTDQIISNSSCVHWSKDSAEHLFQNMQLSLWKAQPSFWNTPSSLRGVQRKLNARLRVWKARPSTWKTRSRVCVITRPMLSQPATVNTSQRETPIVCLILFYFLVNCIIKWTQKITILDLVLLIYLDVALGIKWL